MSRAPSKDGRLSLNLPADIKELLITLVTVLNGSSIVEVLIKIIKLMKIMFCEMNEGETKTITIEKRQAHFIVRIIQEGEENEVIIF